MVTRRALLDAAGLVLNVVVGGADGVVVGEFDAVNIGDTWDGTAFARPPSTPESPEQIAARLESAVQRHLDTTAQAAGYDSILSACSYAGAPNPYQHEAIAFLAWRGAVWAHCYGVLDAVTAGSRAVPTESELIVELPEMDA